MQATPELRAAARTVAIHELWRRGDLYYRLHATQRKIYDAIGKSDSKRHYICCSRRLGKSTMLVCMAFELCIRKPGARILYLAPLAKDAADIVQDITAKLLPDCPAAMRPDFKSQKNEFQFPNGSVIRFKGTNNETAEYLRGGEADMVILDECGSMDALQDVVSSVVGPMVLTTRGTVIMATTPSKTPEHDSKLMWERACRDGSAHEYTLLDAPHMDAAQKTEALTSDGGEDPVDVPDILSGKALPKTTKKLREYFCKWITEASSAVVPEFDAKARSEIVCAHERPPYFDAYVSMDPGFVDKTGILFAFWDAKAHRLVIEDEVLLSHAGTPDIADAIRTKERTLWGDAAPYMRVSDVEKRLISDLASLHGLPFVQAIKRDGQGSIFLMRQMVKNRTLVIRPNCTQLIRQIEGAVWNKRVTDFEHEVKQHADEVPGHYDLLAALKYLCRMCVTNRNPFPSWYMDGPERMYQSHREPKAKKTIRTDTPLSRKLDKAGK